VAHVKLALRLQLQQQYAACLDALLKAIYLLPPSPQFLQQQRSNFARRHHLSTSAAKSADPAPFVADAGEQADLSGELHEVLILWRARLQVHLAQHDGAVADLEFYSNSLLAGESAALLAAGPAGKTTRKGGIHGGRRRRRAGYVSEAAGAIEDAFASDSDEDADEGGKLEDLLAVSLGLSESLAAPGTTAASSRAPSVAEALQPLVSDAFAAPVAEEEEDASEPQFASAEEEQRYLFARAFYAHRARVRHSRLLCYLGSLYHVRRQDSDSLRCYTASLALDGHNLYALLNRALVSRLQGRFSNAITDLFDAVAVLKKMSDQATTRAKTGADLRTMVEATSPDSAFAAATAAAAATVALPSAAGTASSSSLPAGAVTIGGMVFDPALDPGLHVVPVLQFTPAQQRVHAVLLKYGETLKLSPQEHWDSITGIQGELAIAVDAANRERAAAGNKQQRTAAMPTAPASITYATLSSASQHPLAGAGASLSSSVGDGSTPRAAVPLSTSDSAARFHVALDAAADNLMQHLLDPQQASRNERQQQQLQLQQANAAAGGAAPSAAAAPMLPLDHTFDAAFSKMQALIKQQLAASDSSERAANKASMLLVPVEAAEVTEQTSDDSSSATSASAPAKSHLQQLLNGLQERAAAAAPTDATTGGGASVAAPNARKATAGAPSVLAAGKKARPGNSAATAASLLVTRSGGAGAVVSGAGSSAPLDADAAFESSLDPRLPADVRARRLEEWRQARIAQVRDRLAGLNRSSSYYGLLNADELGQVHATAAAVAATPQQPAQLHSPLHAMRSSAAAASTDELDPYEPN